MSRAVHALYFNGLGYGGTRRRERLAIHYLKKHGIVVTHVPVNWYAAESFDDLFGRLLAATEQQLKQHGKLVLIGSSAGGSLAVNIVGKLHDPSLTAVTLCSRLNEQPLEKRDRRTLKRMALDRKQPSKAFYDSVLYCTDTAIPKLTLADKQRMVTVQQWADDVVPRPTMSIPGVTAYNVPGFGHGWGIAMGTRRLPQIIARFDMIPL